MLGPRGRAVLVDLAVRETSTPRSPSSTGATSTTSTTPSRSCGELAASARSQPEPPGDRRGRGGEVPQIARPRRPPAITSLRARAEEIREAELQKAEALLAVRRQRRRRSRHGADQNKFLHLPTVRMKQAAAAAMGSSMLKRAAPLRSWRGRALKVRQLTGALCRPGLTAFIRSGRGVGCAPPVRKKLPCSRPRRQSRRGSLCGGAGAPSAAGAGERARGSCRSRRPAIATARDRSARSARAASSSRSSRRRCPAGESTSRSSAKDPPRRIRRTRVGAYSARGRGTRFAVRQS